LNRSIVRSKALGSKSGLTTSHQSTFHFNAIVIKSIKKKEMSDYFVFVSFANSIRLRLTFRRSLRQVAWVVNKTDEQQQQQQLFCCRLHASPPPTSLHLPLTASLHQPLSTR
jgi:hypothetical protein